MTSSSQPLDLEAGLTPKEIVKELDKYIIGQRDAKNAVAIALRNRWRRKRLPDSMKDEVAPKNIIMMGPTGVGKTEIARRLAKIVHAPFVKVEATKYTEVGYVGRDVESMVRDLVATAINDVRADMSAGVEAEARAQAEEKLIDLLLPSAKKNASEPQNSQTLEKKNAARERLKAELAEGKLDNGYVEIKVRANKAPSVELMPGMNPEDSDMLQSMIGAVMPQRKKTKKMTVRDARAYLIEEATDSMIDMEKVVSEALALVENMGIIFLDEIDKIASPNRADSQDVARHGVQRDLLPIVEGTSVHTRYGSVKTDHILFIAAGAFHVTKPSDLIPELQGRFPIRVELNALRVEDFKEILTVPENAITKQYAALMETEGVTLTFSDDAIDFIASMAYEVNTNTENIGARRLHTIMEKTLEEVSFTADEHKGSTITVDRAFAERRLAEITKNRDLSRYIL